MSDDGLVKLISIMARLRDPDGGCPWDLAQSFVSIAPYTIEEAYEVAQAIDDNDMHALRDELGDLLFQTVFHARMAEEAGYFNFSDVVAAITDKMLRRHPHVFGAAVADHDAQSQKLTWEAIKAAERAVLDDGTPKSALHGVAAALPALMRAEKLQSRAARTGFDWPDSSGPRAKIYEEMAEFEAASNGVDRLEEAGDLIFALVNYLRHNAVDAEQALRLANHKFERRFSAMEALANGQFETMNLAAMDRLWEAVKQAEKRS